MTKSWFFGALLAWSLIGSSASAGLMIEPYFGYDMGVVDASISGANLDAGGKTTAMDLGLRAGYKLPVLLWVAADYNTAMSGKFSAGNTTVLPDSDFDETNLYLDVGIDLPILLRAWFGYGLGTKMTEKASSGDTEFSGGTAYKLGVGFTGLPFISINLEYYNWAPDTYHDSTGDHSVSSFFSSFKSTGLVLSASLPLDL